MLKLLVLVLCAAACLAFSHFDVEEWGIRNQTHHNAASMEPMRRQKRDANEQLNPETDWDSDTVSSNTMAFSQCWPRTVCNSMPRYLYPRSEANRLYDAMDGIGTDEDVIIDVMARRPSHERAEIARAYKAAYDENLAEDFDSELSGNFYETCRGLCYQLSDFLAICLKEAMEGSGTDEEALIDILTTQTKLQIRAIKEAYQRLFHVSLESDIRSDTNGDFRRVLVLLVNKDRKEDHHPEHPPNNLISEGRLRTEDIRYLCRRPLPEVAAVAAAYKLQQSHSLQDAISAQTSGDYRDALLSIISFAEDPAMHVATMLHRSMDGSGTNDRRLLRTIIAFSDVNMPAVKAAFKLQYGESLKDMIREDTTGYYEQVLQTLIGDA